MKSEEKPLIQIQKLVALTTFLTEKALVLAGADLFNGKLKNLQDVTQKESQIDRLCTELDEQLIAYSHSSPGTSGEVQSVILMKTIGDGLRIIAKETLKIAVVASFRDCSELESIQDMHSTYEASCILLAQAVGAFIEKTSLNTDETIQNLRSNQRHLAMLGDKLQRHHGDVNLSEMRNAETIPLVVSIRNIAVRTQGLAGEISMFLTSWSLTS